jgi:hypothetical protein
VLSQQVLNTRHQTQSNGNQHFTGQINGFVVNNGLTIKNNRNVFGLQLISCATMHQSLGCSVAAPKITKQKTQKVKSIIS